jgi:hypothetical protein
MTTVYEDCNEFMFLRYMKGGSLLDLEIHKLVFFDYILASPTCNV